MKPGSHPALIAPLACIMLALAAGHGLGAVDAVGTVPAAGAPAGGASDPAPPDEGTEQAIRATIQTLAARHHQVIRCHDSGIPPGWESLSAGAHLQVGDAGPLADCWLMPRDWIAVCSPAVATPRLDVLHTPDLIILTISDRGGWDLTAELRPPQQAGAATMSGRFAFPPPHWAPTPDRCTAEEARRGTAAARATYARFVIDDFHRDFAVQSIAMFRPHAVPFYREMCGEGHSCIERARAIDALVEQAEAEDVRLFASLLNHEDPDHDYSMVQGHAAMALHRIADPATVPDLVTALQHLPSGSEALHQVIDTLAELDCRAAGGAILAALRAEANPFYQGSIANALGLLRFQEAVPLIRGLCRGRTITGQAIAESCMAGNAPQDPLVALARLTLPWGSLADHARLALLPARTVTTLKGHEAVTLLIECVGGCVSELAYDFGIITIDGIDHQLPPPGGIMGNFTMQPGRIAHRGLELTDWITTPGTYQVSYRAGGAVANALSLTVVDGDR